MIMLTSNQKLTEGPVKLRPKKMTVGVDLAAPTTISCALGHTDSSGMSVKIHLVTQGDVSKEWKQEHTIHLCAKHGKELEDIGPSCFIKNYRHELRRNSPAFLSHLRDLEKRPDIPPSDSHSGDTALHNRPD